MSSRTLIIMLIVVLQSFLLPKFKWKYTIYLLPLLTLGVGGHHFIQHKDLFSLAGYLLLAFFLLIMGVSSYSDEHK